MYMYFFCYGRSTAALVIMRVIDETGKADRMVNTGYGYECTSILRS